MSSPRHIGIIPDGNRRWARRNGLPVIDGFREGAAHIPQVLGWCAEEGIEFITLWVMSTNNLSRSPSETTAMITIAEQAVGDLVRQRRWRLRAVGATDQLPATTRELLTRATDATAEVRGPVVNLAAAYDGRWDVVEAVRALLRTPAFHNRTGKIIADELTPERLAGHLSTADQPDLDLVIRTSGEVRLSGFMSWQVAESELFFVKTLWPDFSRAEFRSALHSYQQRQRRFGR